MMLETGATGRSRRHAAPRNGRPSCGRLGREPDKQWITIDANPTRADGSRNPNYNTIYAMFVLFSFDGLMSKPYVSTAGALADGTHTDWTPLQVLPTGSGSASDTYLLRHLDGNGVVWTTVTNFPNAMSRSTYNINLIWSTDGGVTWNGPLPTPARSVALAPFSPGYVNTTFGSGIANSFAVGANKINGKFPLYVTWEDHSGGISNSFVSTSFDSGRSWPNVYRVSDNQSMVTSSSPV